jgi:hypothetical protein
LIGYLKERDHYEDLGIGRKIILKCILKWDGGMRNLLVWLVIGTSGGLL